MSNFQVLINVIIMLALVYGFIWMQKKHYSFTIRVLSALLVGIVYGAVLQLAYGPTSSVVKDSNTWFGIIGTGYVSLLKMIVIPLIFVAITTAITNQTTKNLGKTAMTIILILVITAGISAIVGATTANVAGLNAQGLQKGSAETTRGQQLNESLKSFQAKSIQDQLIGIIPTNPFYSMTGQGSNSTLSVVFFAAFMGIATIGIRKKKPESAEVFTKFLNALNDVVMRMVTIILRLTPFGVLALMTKVVSTSKFNEILRLIEFVIASYIAIIIMFLIHAIILRAFGFKPSIFFKKSAHVFSFAFTSRTSLGTLPITVEALKSRLGVSDGIANLSASLGTSIGQNGCAGIYPAMVAVMIAPAVGIDPLAPAFLIKLVIVTAIASFGIAGVGGGATFSALTVLSVMGLPIELVGLLIAIEPLIDMGRTALNVSDSMLSGLVSSKLLNEVDMNVYNQMKIVDPGQTTIEI